VGNNNAIIKFLEDELWKNSGANNTAEEIIVMPSTFRKIVHGFDIYFPAKSYDCEWPNYENLANMVSDVMHGAAWVDSAHMDYYVHGYMHIRLNLAHENYSDETTINMLKSTLKTIKKTKLPPPARE